MIERYEIRADKWDSTHTFFDGWKIVDKFNGQTVEDDIAVYAKSYAVAICKSMNGKYNLAARLATK